MHTRDDPEALFATVHRPPKADLAPAADRTADAGSLEARSMLELQRMAGNASVSRLLAAGGLDAGRKGAAPGIGDEELEDDQLEAHTVGVRAEALRAEGKPGPPSDEELGEGDDIKPPEQSPPGPEEQAPDEEELKRQQGG
jgi:hypothetical protein